MFGKLMSISDDLMWRYYVLLTDLTPEALLEKRAAVSRGELHPEAGEGRAGGGDRRRISTELRRRAGGGGVRAAVRQEGSWTSTSCRQLDVDAAGGAEGVALPRWWG